MKTAYYTLYTCEMDADTARVSGGEDRLVLLTPRPLPRRHVQRESNVISLADYLPAQEPEFTPDAEPMRTAQTPAPRMRTNRSMERLIRMEWAACAAIVCMGVVACIALLL